GLLDHIDLKMKASTNGGIVPLTVLIVEAAAGVPSGNVLGAVTTAALPGTVTPAWTSIAFSPQPVFLQTGMVYGIVLTNNASSSGAHSFAASSSTNGADS